MYKHFLRNWLQRIRLQSRSIKVSFWPWHFLWDHFFEKKNIWQDIWHFMYIHCNNIPKNRATKIRFGKAAADLQRQIKTVEK